MKLLKIDCYRDGGTIKISTDKGVFCIDNRIDSKLKGHVFNGYPKDDNSNYAPSLHVVITKLLQSYSGDNIFYVEQSLKLLKQPGIRLRERIFKAIEEKKMIQRSIQSYCKRYGYEIGRKKALDYLKRIHGITIL